MATALSGPGPPRSANRRRPGRPRTIAAPLVYRSSPWPAHCPKHRIAPSPDGPSIRLWPPCLRLCTPMGSAAQASGVSFKTLISNPTKVHTGSTATMRTSRSKPTISLNGMPKRWSSQQNRLLICCDEKTGRQVLERKAPTKPAQPGRRERREHEYIRHGTRVLIDSLAVATGQIAWTLGSTRKATDFVAHLKQAYQNLPRMTRYDWVMDNLNTHWSLDVCRLVAYWCKGAFEPHKLKKGPRRRACLSDPDHRHVFHCTRSTARGSIRPSCSLACCPSLFGPWQLSQRQGLCPPLGALLKDYNARHAHPYRWTYTGEPLVRDIPFSRTRRQQRQGRACFSPRPKRFERLLYSPRPYRRQAA